MPLANAAVPEMMRDQEGGLHDRGRFRMLGGCIQSEMGEQANTATRRLIIERTAQL
jgi:hypothetical protein